MKKVWVSILLSLIYPGIGHFYLGKVKKGVFLIVLEFLGILLLSIGIGLFIFPIVWLYAIIDAYRITNQINTNPNFSN